MGAMGPMGPMGEMGAMAIMKNNNRYGCFEAFFMQL